MLCYSSTETGSWRLSLLALHTAGSGDSFLLRTKEKGAKTQGLAEVEEREMEEPRSCLRNEELKSGSFKTERGRKVPGCPAPQPPTLRAWKSPMNPFNKFHLARGCQVASCSSPASCL